MCIDEFDHDEKTVILPFKTDGSDTVRGDQDHDFGIGITGHAIGIRYLVIRINSIKSQYFNSGSEK